MRNLFTFLTILVFLFPSTTVDAQVQTPIYKAMSTMTNAYYEYLPQGYSAKGSKKYPLILFITGEGELGDGTPANLPTVLRNGTPMQISQGIFPASFTVNGQTFSFIVLSPQFSVWPTESNIDTVLDYALKNYNVDVNRVYLTGLSMGGGVVWQYAGNNSTYASRIAAMVPICGASWPDVGRSDIIAAGDIPVWATHNNGDPTCPVTYTIDYVNNINSAPILPNPLANKTIFNSNSHDAWTATYDLSFVTENNLNIYQWMLQFSRGNVILPITGLSLKLQKKDNSKVLLTWQTYSEINNKGFTIERSADGITFNSIGFVKSTSTNGSGASYSFIDALPTSGKNYYRLSQLDNNGASKLSPVEFINLGNLSGIKLYPNPVRDVININADHLFTNAQLNIWDASGHLTQQVLLNGSGTNLPVKNLPAGIYSAEIKDGVTDVKIPFIKQ
jgi:hypothetical protein